MPRFIITYNAGGKDYKETTEDDALADIDAAREYVKERLGGNFVEIKDGPYYKIIPTAQVSGVEIHPHVPMTSSRVAAGSVY